MQDEAEVRKKLRELRYRYKKRYLHEHLRKGHRNCVHNYIHVDAEGNEVGLCMLGAEDPANWPGNICDDDETAEACPYFENKYNKEYLKQEFELLLADPEILYTKFRDIALLGWVLGEQTSMVPISEAPDLTWWQRMTQWIKGD